jgi:poly(hydroxyalkanoate) depolymerase family esterase
MSMRTIRTKAWRRAGPLFGLGQTTAELAAVRRRWKALLGLATALAPAPARRAKPVAGKKAKPATVKPAKTGLARSTGPKARPAALSKGPGRARLQEIRAFGANPGGLRMFAGIPASLRPGAPLVVVLHGCGQSASTYDAGSGWSRLGAEEGFAVLYPEQHKRNNSQGCFSWYQHRDVTRDGAGEAASIREMIEHLVAAHALDRRRIFVTGLSAGAAMANVMLAVHPEIFAGGALIGGLPYGAASGMAEAYHAMVAGRRRDGEDWAAAIREAAPEPPAWPTVSVWHGTADDTVRPVNATETVKQWRTVHGLAKEPPVESVEGRLKRRAWPDAEGTVKVEEVLVEDMGHGTPVDRPVEGEDGRFFLDVGIASTRLIAASWGLAASLS